MDKSSYGFELLNYVWLEGYCGWVFGDEGSIRFPSLGEAVAELQDDLDTWAREIRDGERKPDQSYAPDEFLIRCVETNDTCGVDFIDGRVEIVALGTGRVIPRSEYGEIERTGWFERHDMVSPES
jgi:hypothetical protein